MTTVSDNTNRHNLAIDRPSYGKWAINYPLFAATASMKLAYAFFENVQKDPIKVKKIIELGSAEGLFGNYFKKRLISIGGDPSLTLVDAIPEHLAANKDPQVQKICTDLLDFEASEAYDLVLIRSVLHYFSKEAQQKIIEKIANLLSPGGVVLVQCFIQEDINKDIYKKLNEINKKKFCLLGQEDLRNMFKNSGLSLPADPLDLPGWEYQITVDQNDARSQKFTSAIKIIASFNAAQRKNFTLYKNEIRYMAPYKIFCLARA